MVAYCRNGYVCCCGWPESHAKESDCELVRKGSLEERMKLLEEMSGIQGSRGAFARDTLAALRILVAYNAGR